MHTRTWIVSLLLLVGLAVGVIVAPEPHARADADVDALTLAFADHTGGELAGLFALRVPLLERGCSSASTTVPSRLFILPSGKRIMP